jgi:hypothetical protein
MKHRFTQTSLTVLTVVSLTAFSAKPAIVEPGGYPVTVDAAGNHMATATCLRDQDTRDLRSLLLTLEDRLMRDHCVVNILEQTTNSADWEMKCENQFVTRTTIGSISWRDGAFKGQAVRTMGAIRMEFPYEAQRNGDCK